MSLLIEGYLGDEKVVAHVDAGAAMLAWRLMID
jgi:hypothetical protein